MRERDLVVGFPYLRINLHLRSDNAMRSSSVFITHYTVTLQNKTLLIPTTVVCK